MDEAGTWVPGERMPPWTNVAGRRWRAKNGSREGRLSMWQSPPLDLAQHEVEWFFPAPTAPATPT